MPDPAEPRQGLTPSEWAALEAHRASRAESEADAQAQADIYAEQQRRAAERRVQEAHVQTLIAQVADLTIANRETDRRMREAERQLQDVARGLEENTSVTVEIRDLLAAFKGGFKVLGWLGAGLKWAAAVAAAGVALWKAWQALKTGAPLGK